MPWHMDDQRRQHQQNKARAAKQPKARPSNSSSGGGNACLISLVMLPVTAPIAVYRHRRKS